MDNTSTLLKQAILDMEAARLEYNDIQRRFPLTDEEAHMADALYCGTMSIDEIYASAANIDNIAEVYHARVKYKRVRSIVHNFIKNPFSVKYENADFDIPRRYYIEASALLHPQQAVKPPTPLVKPQQAANSPTPLAKPQQAANSPTPLAKPQQAANSATPLAKPQQAANPPVPVVKSQQAANPPTPVAKKYPIQNAVIVVLTILLATTLFISSSRRDMIESLEIKVSESYNQGYSEGETHGSDVGYAKGYKDGETEGSSSGYEDGYDIGYYSGYSEGYREGWYYHFDEYSFYHYGACIVTSEGRRYHRYGCYHIEGRTFWIYNIENAEYRGYTPCLDCWEAGSDFELPMPFPIS